MIERYVLKELPIVPVIGKRPFIEDWYNVDFLERKDEFQWKGIGLKMGKASGIICLDFDSTNEEVKKKLKEILPPIFCGKIGNPSKLPTMFFRFNGEISRDLKNIEVQLLSTGKQTVLPPSPHPTIEGKRFTWCANSLLDIEIDDLPDLDGELWQALIDLDSSTTLEGKEREGSLSTGRNNTLKAQVCAAVLNAKTVEEIIDEVVAYDKENHIPPLFEDKTEPTMRSDVYTNALGFVCRIISSVVKQPNIKIERPQPLVLNFLNDRPIVIDEESPIKDKSKRFMKLPKLVGLGDAIFHELYDSAPIPRTQFAFQNTLFFLSLLIGNKFTLRGTGCNIYTYSVGPSASGKDYPFKRTQQLIKACELDHLIGPSSPTSETSILKFLEENREKGCWWNEGEKVLKTMANTQMNYGALECVTDLYDGVGKSYFNKGTISPNGDLRKFGDIFSPYLCITMASTLEAFQAHAKASMFATGLLNRFDIFFEDRPKRVEYRDNFNPVVNEKLVQVIKGLAKDRPLVSDSKSIFKIQNLTETDRAKVMSREIFEFIAKEKTFSQKFEGLLARKILRSTKYAAIHHFMLHPIDPLKVKVDVESIEWGYNCANAIMHNMMQMLPCEVSENEIERNYNKILSMAKKLHDKGSPITKSSLANGMQSIHVSERNAIIKDLIDRKILVQLKDKSFQYNN